MAVAAALNASPRLRAAAAASAVAVCVVAAVLWPAPAGTLRSSDRYHDFLHVPGFALVTGLLLAGFPARPGATPARRLRRLALAGVVSLGAGVLVEALQAVVGGNASAGDVWRDGAGILAVVLVAGSRWPEARPRVRWALRAGALILAAAPAADLIDVLVEESRARREFPVLAGFASPREMGRFVWSPLASATFLDGGRSAGGERGVRVVLSPGQYPGFTLRYFPRDWRAYGSLVLSCENRAETPLPIVIRIDDWQHDQQRDRRHADRYNGRFVLRPGGNEIRVSLAEVAAAPRGRRLDLGEVGQVVVFVLDLAERRELGVRGLWLER